MNETTKISDTQVLDAAKTVRWSQERHLQFIDFRLQWDGTLNRSDLTGGFHISVPQASMGTLQKKEKIVR